MSSIAPFQNDFKSNTVYKPKLPGVGYLLLRDVQTHLLPSNMQLYNVSLLASQQLHLPACCAPRNSASRDASLCLTIAVLGFLVVACAMFSFFQDYPFREYFRGLTTNELKILTILTFMSSSQMRYSVLSSLNCFSSAFCCCKVSVNH